MRWFAPDDQPTKPTPKTAGIRDIASGASPEVADALGHLERMIAGIRRLKDRAAVNVFTSVRTALDDLARALSGGPEQPPVTQRDPAETSSYLATSSSTRGTKVAGVRERAGVFIPKGIMDELANLEGIIVNLLGKHPKKRRATIALDDVVDTIKLELWKTEPQVEPQVSQQDPSAVPSVPAASVGLTKTAKNVKCHECDEYVAEGEMDETGKCETCQKKLELEAADDHWTKAASARA